nr:metallophosphoesterase [uncultured Flavobacterium sp.]
MKFLCTVQIVLILCSSVTAQTNNKIAFLADVHLQDLYGTFKDNAYKGITNPKDGKYTLLRTMNAQLHSTRVFNENYFAFIATLDDIAKRGIKIVALPGDYTDDGQPIHLKGLQLILKEYNSKYGIRFFITTGNHDPVTPWNSPAGKNDFLGKDGKPQPIFSNASLYKQKDSVALPVIITEDIATMGYDAISEYLKDFGFYPNPNILYWATPFSSYTYEHYSYSKALKESAYDTRSYTVKDSYTIPDASYVTEPVKGIWLLALDGNVYIPKKTSDGNVSNPANYSGASVGYNNVLSNKQHLINWVKKVSEEAKRLDKILIAFSHYPMVEFNDNASDDIENLLGKGKWQLERVPTEGVAEAFANAGIRLHFAGHMHINDTGIYKTQQGNTLINIQSPSLAAYIPAYKVLTIHNNENMEVETVAINDVPKFNSLFKLYETEYNYLEQTGSKEIWNKEILTTKSYHDFMLFHLKELVRLRFIPQEWPKTFTDKFAVMNGYQILEIFAGRDANSLLKKSGITKAAMLQWNGFDWIFDLYKLQSADCLALNDIGNKRLKQYNLIIAQTEKNNAKTTDDFTNSCSLFFKIFNKLQKGDPAGNFNINLKTGIITKK